MALGRQRLPQIRPSTLLDALMDFWDICWPQALPLDAPDDDVARAPAALSDGDRALLTLLVAGFADGAIAQHWMSYQIPKPSLPNSEHRYVVVGETGMIDVDAYGKVQLAKDDQWTTVWEQPAIDYVNRPLDPVRLEAFFTQTQAFVDNVLDHRPPTVSGADGRAAVALVEAAWASSRAGTPISLS